VKGDVDSLSLGVEIELSNLYSGFITEVPQLRKEVTFQNSKKKKIHRWFQYTQGFSPGLLEYYFERWNADNNEKFLDPFVGSGTSLVYAQQAGFISEGWDISPLAVHIAKTKTTDVKGLDFENLISELKNNTIYVDVDKELEKYPPQIIKHLNKSFQVGVLKEIFEIRMAIDGLSCAKLRNLCLIAFMSTLEESSYLRKHGSHYRFMNTNNSGIKQELDFSNIDYKTHFFGKLEQIILDSEENMQNIPKSEVRVEDARVAVCENPARYVITSPPYLNRNNYIAQSKMELFLSGLICNFDEYRSLTKKTLRSHVEAETTGVEKLECPFVDRICEIVTERGESYRGVSKMIKGYFEDMIAVMNNLANSLSKGALVAMVIGCSRWSGVVVPTDLLVAHHAVGSGNYSLKSIDVVRYKGNAPQQMAKWGRYPVRESIIVLEKVT